MIEEIFEMYGQRFVDLAKSKVPVVTGKTRDSISYEVVSMPSKISLLIKGRPFMQTIETGRGPFKGGQQGGFADALEEWLQAKGFPKREGKNGVTSYNISNGGKPKWITAKGLSIVINNSGDSKHRSKSITNVYSSDFDILTEQLKKDIGKYIKEEFVKVIKP